MLNIIKDNSSFILKNKNKLLYTIAAIVSLSFFSGNHVVYAGNIQNQNTEQIRRKWAEKEDKLLEESIISFPGK